jgi:hypothetical protein
MGHFARLQLVGRVTYYIGWLSLVCGALMHLGIGRGAFLAMSLTKRNLFEVSIVCFVVCIASELRAATPVEGEAKNVAKRAAAA